MYSHAKELIKYLPAVSEFDVNVFEAILTIQSFQTDQIQISSRKIFTAHYACRNADFNFTLVMGTTKGFIFQIINSLMESWGLRMGEESRAAFSFPLFPHLILSTLSRLMAISLTREGLLAGYSHSHLYYRTIIKFRRYI